ncbi:MAG: Regulatory protein RecX [Candidatus Gottesmanbacteria bacterium GW2011_GWC2_39_8]|uniref:Regulatory protein RecX n=1 Tax=Candidatus Gottesmanbacteria bacterium GW2011_GWC2_39_8 TaxID=1618450 RepID=A0A0G0PY56_9BACT|nr:MAG: Regulatory protein RecX [Candidatus Gottesmanbacteria bacterium GW2011_GWC2_39_8]
MTDLTDSDKEKIILLTDKALNLLSFRPRTCHEMKGKLVQEAVKKGITLDKVEIVIESLKEKRFLSDEDFARWWIDQRETFRPKGERAIKIELRQKGLDQEIINAVLEERKETGKNDFELALSLAQKKIGRLSNLPLKERKEKIIGILQRRGFDWETVSAVIANIFEK